MRPELLYSPRLLVERLATLSVERRRLARLKNTAAHDLGIGHIDSLELLDLARALQPQIVYDIGANVGTWTKLAIAAIPGAAVHVFEPLPIHLESLRRALGALSQVSIHPIALGAASGEAAFHVLNASDASSFLPLTDSGARDWDLVEQTVETIQIKRLDDLVTANVLPLPDLMKLDVQGFELQVLSGATQCLRSASAVITEVSFVEIYQGQPLFADIVAFLKDHGFLAQAFGFRTPTGQLIKQADVLFLAERFVH